MTATDTRPGNPTDTAETDALGNMTRSEWDRYDRLLSRTDPLGRTTAYTWLKVPVVPDLERVMAASTMP